MIFIGCSNLVKRIFSSGYTATIGKTVGAKYAKNLYHEIRNENGERFVVRNETKKIFCLFEKFTLFHQLTCRPEQLQEYQTRLSRLLAILRKRLSFLSTGSRRVFGVLAEPSICFVCDCKTGDHRIFNQYQIALKSLFKEQVSKIKRFNLIW